MADDNLLRTKQILMLSSPRNSELSFLRDWLDSESGGNCFLKGIESKPYDEDHVGDLITLSPTAEKDPFAEFLSDTIVPLFHRRIGHRKKATDNGLGPLWEYKSHHFERFADVMCAVLSSMIPIISISLLCYVQEMVHKLIIVTTLNFFFSFIMAVFVRGRRIDVFAASTAFAAMQVVFIGGVTIVWTK